MFKGSIVALITPFKNNVLDQDKYASLIHYHIKNGTKGVVPAGTTGESPTLDHEEHKKVIEISVKESNGKIPVIAGTGSNSTSEAIELSKHAEKSGANGLLIVTPYYNKPTQEGLYQHYKKINDNVGIPIIIYNIPPRSVIDMSVDTMARLFELKNITGVKDATADLNRVDQQLKKMGKEFIQLSGEDGTALAYLAAGGHGCISVTANIAPKLLSRMHNAWKQGDINTAQVINKRLMPLHDALFCETSPGPLKYAASLLGICSSEARLPIVEIEETSKNNVKDALKKTGLI